MASTVRVVFAVVALFLLCMKSVSHSAPLACEDLVRPLDRLDPRLLEDRWALVAGTIMPYFPQSYRGSMSMFFSNSTEKFVYSFTQYNGIDGHCANVSYNFTLDNSTFTADLDEDTTLTWSFLYTSCPDCVVTHTVIERERRPAVELSLYSRRRQLKEKELEEFRAQAECVKMSPPVVMDPTIELCPKQTDADPAAQTDAKTEGLKA